jgi:hypothetical protein
MESFLKTSVIHVESLDCDLEISELCAKAQIEILECLRSEQTLNAYFIACKYGVLEWREETTDELSMKLPLQAAREVSDAIYKLSGLDESKNSDSVPSEDSSTD